jgi:nicotinamidase-related amidase
VDVEYNFTGESPQPVLTAIETFADSCGEYAWASVPVIRRLLDRCRAAGLPVCFTHGRPPAPGAPDRGTTIVAEVAPRPEDLVLAKAAPSAFFGTHLASHLIAHGVDTVIVTGGTTSGCVRATVVDSHSYRFRTIVPIEAVFDRADTPHRASLFDMAMKYATVMPARDAEAYIAEIASMAGGDPVRAAGEETCPD